MAGKNRKKKSGGVPKNPYRVANPEWSKAMHEKGRSNCTQPHDSRPNRERSRQDAKRAAIRNHDW